MFPKNKQLNVPLKSEERENSQKISTAKQVNEK